MNSNNKTTIYNLSMNFKLDRVVAIAGLTYLATHGNVHWVGLFLVWFGFLFYLLLPEK